MYLDRTPLTPLSSAIVAPPTLTFKTALSEPSLIRSWIVFLLSMNWLFKNVLPSIPPVNETPSKVFVQSWHPVNTGSEVAAAFRFPGAGVRLKTPPASVTMGFTSVHVSVLSLKSSPYAQLGPSVPTNLNTLSGPPKPRQVALTPQEVHGVPKPPPDFARQPHSHFVRGVQFDPILPQRQNPYAIGLIPNKFLLVKQQEENVE